MAYTKSDLDRLQGAIAKGVKSTQMGGEKIEFRSFDEMRRLERKLKVELGLVKPPRRMHYPKTSSGFR